MERGTTMAMEESTTDLGERGDDGMDLGECRKERWWTRGRRVAQLAEDRGRRRAGDSGGGGERRAAEAEWKRRWSGSGAWGAGFFCSPHAVQNKRSCGSDYEGGTGELRHLVTLLGFSRGPVGALPNRLLDSYV